VLKEREQLAMRLRQLAAQGVFLGTSSWKYPGWFDIIYDRERYVWRKRFSEARFERDCLAEYALTFPSVSVDATYYKFPARNYLEGLAAQVPDTFRFGLKVTSDITLKRFPGLPRFGPRAGAVNTHFLDASLFTDAFLASCDAIRDKVGVIMFEFSHFGPAEFERGAQFVEALDQFFAKLPRGWPYAIELRNRHWLRPEYFAVLARHGITHIYNAWEDTLTPAQQIELPQSETNPPLLVARFLLREGRSYEQAVSRFSPYTKIQDPNPEGRAAAVKLVRRALKSQGRTKAMIFVNNRYEGHSPGTIRAILDLVESGPPD
jgi:uncharacterized protein YecE (DUF72 family)